MGDCSIDLSTLFVEIAPAEIPVENGFEQVWLAPEHRPGREVELAVS